MDEDALALAAGRALGEPRLRCGDPDKAELYVGVDVGWTQDSSAVCWAARLPDGRICLRAKVWTTDERSLGEYAPGGRMELALVEAFIRELAARYRLRELAYNPSYFGRSAQELERAGIETVEFMPGGAPMRQAWQSFYQAAKKGCSPTTAIPSSPRTSRRRQPSAASRA